MARCCLKTGGGPSGSPLFHPPMPKNIGYPARKLPSQRVAERMSRSDSLRSMSEFGEIVPPSQQQARRDALKPRGIFSRLKRALGGK